MSRYIFTLLLCAATAAMAQKPYYMLTGTYTSGKSEGIYVYEFLNGELSLISSTKASNPSYLVVAPNQRFVYAVTEDSDTLSNTGGGTVSAFSFDPKQGKLTLLNRQPSAGNHPCYIDIHPKGKWLAAGNYSDGTLSILPIQDDGSAGAPVQVIKHNGSGANASRQQSPHVHATRFSSDGSRLYVPDLGTDKLMQYRFDAYSGQLQPHAQPFVNAIPGSGPRHVDYTTDNQYVYVMEELTGTVTAYKNTNGILKMVQLISALPADYHGPVSSADIHVSPDNRFLYCSNRGQSNTIAIFAINQSTGSLTLLGHQGTLGTTPRNFSIDPSGNYLLVANQQSSNIVIFSRNTKTGLLTYTGKQVEVPNPVCIKWVEKNK